MGSKNFLKKIKNLKTPFYFYDMGLLEETLRRVVHEAAKYGYSVHYALKANFEDHLLEKIRDHGLGADCVSGNEVKKAIGMGFPPQQIVFAGVGKTDDEIRYGLRAGIFSFNCESRQELQVIDTLAAEEGVVANVALRINPDVDPKTHRYITTGKTGNKFGIHYNEIEEVVASLHTLGNVRITGLHFHIGSQIRDLQVYRHLCDRVNAIQPWFEERGICLQHINLGGGLGIDYDHPENEPVADFGALFGLVHENLTVREGQTVHFELGRSIVGQCGELVSRVLYTKTSGDGSKFIIIDAGMTDLIRPALYQAHHKMMNLTADPSITDTYTIGGPVCESSDIFASEIRFPVTKRDDLIAIQSAGAYGSAMASHYNMRDTALSVYSDRL